MSSKQHLDQLLDKTVSLRASDLHLTSNDIPMMRLHGRIEALGDNELSGEHLDLMFDDFLSDLQKEEYRDFKSLDIGYSAANGERFRINCYREMGQNAMAARHLNQTFTSLKELELPEQIRKLAYLSSGLVLVTGATGSGKSTTLAALINEINCHRQCHILTIEDPVEFIHKGKKSIVHHRELHSDVPSFADAIRSALREDPDVIMVGEMRDIDTMRAALTAAETGHLVISTLHTGDAVGTIERLVGSFPGNEQDTARHRIAVALRAVLSQYLLPKSNGQGRIPAVEILMVNLAVTNLIENNKTRQIYSTMESGSNEGMQTLDQSLAKLAAQRKVEKRQALALCKDAEALEKMIQLAVLRGSA